LPAQVTYYRGVFERRQADLGVSTLPPADLVTAQQALTLNVQNYLAILGSLWTSVVGVADLIQTPDLFQLAQPHELPPLPPLDQMPHWLCPHHRAAAVPVAAMAGNGCAPAAPAVKPVPVTPGPPAPTQPLEGDPVLPEPRKNDLPATLPPVTEQQRPEAKPMDLTQQLLEPPPEIPKKMKRNEGGEAAAR
jgi:cobalt-zinc-cadmium efflux system outer membrane protein